MRVRRREYPLPHVGKPQRSDWVRRVGYRQFILNTIVIRKCLVNAHLISQPRVERIMMPLLIKDGGASPCRFIAVKE